VLGHKKELRKGVAKKSIDVFPELVLNPNPVKKLMLTQQSNMVA
jgi:hypothetical protein